MSKRSTNEYTPVILEVGSRFIRAGFAGKNTPTVVRSTSAKHCYDVDVNTLPNLYGLNDGALSTEQRNSLIQTADKIDPQRKIINEFYLSEVHKLIRLGRQRVLESLSKSDDLNLLHCLHNIFNIYLLVSPRKCKVILVDSSFSIAFKFKILDVLINVLKVRSVIIQESAALAMIGSGKRDGLIIDIGWESVRLDPILDLRNIRHNAKSCEYFDHFNGQALHYKLLRKILDLEADNGITELLLRCDLFEVLEDFIINCSYVSAKANANEVDNEMFEILKNVYIPNRLRYEIFEDVYFQNDAFYKCIEQAIIDHLNVDTSSALYKCMVFTGGVSCIPGFRPRLLEELKFRFGEKVDSKESLGPWSSCSLYVSAVLTKQDKTKWKAMEITEEILKNLTSDTFQHVYKLSGLCDAS